MVKDQPHSLIIGLLCLFTIGCSDVQFESIPNEKQTSTSPCGGSGCSQETPPPKDDNSDDNGSTEPEQPEEPAYQSITQSFQQVAVNKKLDILFVDDSSISMKADRRELGQKFENFIKQLQGVDWQIGITTTAADDDELQGSLLSVDDQGNKILRPETGNVEAKFFETIQLPMCQGSSRSRWRHPACNRSKEQPLRASLRAMQKSQKYESSGVADLFRKEADLAIVILSDEDEMSDGPSEATKPHAVLKTFNNLWGDKKDLNIYGIVVPPGNKQCFKEQEYDGGHYGTHVNRLVQMTDGVIGSICAEDYSPILSKMGQKARKNLLQRVKLKHHPVKSSVSVQFRPQQNIQWTIQGRQIEFNQAPKEASLIEVNYKHQIK